MKTMITMFAVLLLPLMSHAVTMKPADASRATFEAVGRPSLLKIKGEGAAVTGQLNVEGSSVTGTFDVNVDQFDTGMGLRNTHMKDNYLKTKEYPKSTLKVTSVDVPAGWTPGKDLSDVPFKGDFTLKGVTKPVSGAVSVKGAKLETDAKFEISLNDYNVGVPKYMGVTVADTVKVAVKIPSFEQTAAPAASPAPAAPKTGK